MKGIMVTLLVFLMTGTVIGQQSNSNSANDFSLLPNTSRRDFSTRSTDVPAPKYGQQVRVASQSNGIGTSPTQAQSTVNSGARQPFKLPLAAENIDLMKRQGFIYSQIPTPYVPNVNGVVLKAPNRTEPSQNKNTIRPTLGEDGILHFEVDDYTIDHLDETDFEFQIPEEMQGKYDYVVLNYRQNGTQRGDATKPISREELRNLTSGPASPVRDNQVSQASGSGSTNSIGGGTSGFGGVDSRNTDFRNPADRNTDFRNPADRSTLSDVVRPPGQWRLPGQGQQNNPNLTPRNDNQTELARLRWEADQRRIAEDNAERERQRLALLNQNQKSSSMLDQEWALLQREKEEMARMKQDLYDRSRQGLQTTPADRYADRNTGVRNPLYDTMPLNPRLANNGLANNGFTNPNKIPNNNALGYPNNRLEETTIDRLAREKMATLQRQQETLNLLNQQIQYNQQQFENGQRQLQQVQNANNQNANNQNAVNQVAYQNQLSGTTGNQNNLNRYGYPPNAGRQDDRSRIANNNDAPFVRRDMSMQIPAVVSEAEISQSFAKGVRNLGDRAANAYQSSKVEGALWLMTFLSFGLNVYLWWLARGFYVRYGELADELRETFTATTTL